MQAGWKNLDALTLPTAPGGARIGPKHMRHRRGVATGSSALACPCLFPGDSPVLVRVSDGGIDFPFSRRSGGVSLADCFPFGSWCYIQLNIQQTPGSQDQSGNNAMHPQERLIKAERLEHGNKLCPSQNGNGACKKSIHSVVEQFARISRKGKAVDRILPSA